MAFSATEEAIYNHVKGSLPPWFFALERAEEFMGALVKVFDRVREYREALFDQAFILRADFGPPSWIAEHAYDRGTSPQTDETLVALRQRLRNIPDAVVYEPLRAGAQAIVDAEGVVGTVVLLALKRSRAFMQDSTSDAGTAGVFELVTGTTFKYTPTVPFAAPPTVGQDRLIIAGSTTGGNDGTFVIAGLDGAGVTYDNATGVAEAHPGAWTVQHRDADGNIRDGFRRAYLGRGYRIGPSRPAYIVVMLPYGCTEGTRQSVLEMLRSKAAAGVGYLVEVRANP